MLNIRLPFPTLRITYLKHEHPVNIIDYYLIIIIDNGCNIWLR